MVRYYSKGENSMNALLKAKKQGMSGLDRNKKELQRKASGKASSRIDWNKVRDEWKYEK